MSIRPDLDRWRMLREEMDERIVTGGAPQRDKDESSVHPLLRYAVRVGIPSVMASLLVTWLVLKLDKKLDTHSTLMREHMVASSRMELLMEKVVALQLVQCVNGAVSAGERADCSRASR